ncbi:MAG: electron transfer flavoprotein subunit alpha/FixB family protein [Gemmatimonadetes bacterium]|nr:electron transfer flavoprotein subunit alpha/FixB family protein [Gemmatimonadota bacterium]
MANVLAFAEQRDGEIRGAAREAVSAAARVASGFGGGVHALVLGAPGIGVAGGDLGRFGAAEVHAAEHAALADYNGEGYAGVVAEQIRSGGYAAVIFPATALGKDLAPRVAALLDVPLAGDVTSLEVEGGVLKAIRPVYSGKAFAQVRMSAAPAMVTIRPNVFQPVESPAPGAVRTFTPGIDSGSWKVRLVERKGAGEGALDVAEATTVVAGGRGMKDPSNWVLLEALRDAVGAGAALGASRAVVDAGWRPHGEQVGQTGKTVAPKLYIAVGISGAIQHLAGMRTSKTIVAVNKDPDAPIFNVADYGIVGDLFEVLPRLTEAVKALKAQG